MALGKSVGTVSLQISGFNFRMCLREMTHNSETGGKDLGRDQFMDDEVLSRPGAVGERKSDWNQ